MDPSRTGTRTRSCVCHVMLPNFSDCCASSRASRCYAGMVESVGLSGLCMYRTEATGCRHNKLEQTSKAGQLLRNLVPHGFRSAAALLGPQGFRVEDSCFRIQDLGFRAWGLGSGIGFRV